MRAGEARAATIHVDKYKELVAKTKLAHGDKISVEALAKLCFKRNLLLFPEFATVSQAIAQPRSDASLESMLALWGGRRIILNGLRHCCNTYVTCRPRSMLSRSG